MPGERASGGNLVFLDLALVRGSGKGQLDLPVGLPPSVRKASAVVTCGTKLRPPGRRCFSR